MSTLKKALIICLASALCMTVSSCGKKEKKSALVGHGSSVTQTDGKKDKDKDKDKDNAKDKTENDKSADDDKAKDTEKDKSGNASKSSKTEEELTVYEPGVLTADTYKSKFIGIKFDLPQGYNMASKEEIDKQNEVAANSEEERQRDVSYEAVITNQDSTIQFIVCVDKNKGSYSEEMYLAEVAKSYETIEGSDVSDMITDEEIAGKIYRSISITRNGSTIKYNIRKVGDNIITIIEAYVEETKSDAEMLMTHFKKY